jgi:hypothetical protein
VNGTSSPISFFGLTNSSSYACSVKATNSAGTGSASAESSVTPSASTTTVPGKPVLQSLSPGAAQITVAFTKGTGATPTSYTATCDSTTSSLSLSEAVSPLIVTGTTAETGYTCTVTAYTATAFSATSNSLSTTTSSAVTYSTPSNFKTLVENAFTPSTTLTTSSSPTNRYRYMISNASSATDSSDYLAIGDTYSPTAGYGVTSEQFKSSPTPTYNDYLKKTIQFVQDSSDTTETYFRLDSHLHPNNSLDVDSTSGNLMKFRNNFGKATTTYGYVTFSYDSTTKLLKARKRYTYTYASSTATTPYLASYTASTTYTKKYLNYSSSTKTYSLSSTGTKFYLYATPLSLEAPRERRPRCQPRSASVSLTRSRTHPHK